MVFPVPQLGRATLRELHAIPDADRFHEIVDGEIVRKGEPSFEHSAAISNLSAWLGPFARAPSPGDGTWWLATGVEILFEKAQIYRPDHAGWRRDAGWLSHRAHCGSGRSRQC